MNWIEKIKAAILGEKRDYIEEFFNEVELPKREYEYPYKVFSSKNSDAVFIGKTFKHRVDAPRGIFETLMEGFPPYRKFLLPILIGEIEGKIRYLDISHGHLLAAGRTRSGKTCFLSSAITSLLHFSHPEYLKLICIDPKEVSFKEINQIARVACSNEEISNVIDDLYKELTRRQGILKEKGKASSVKKNNQYAYSLRNKNNVIPYIVVVFDEFADYMLFCEEESKKKIYALAAKGIAAGIHLIIATQSPYQQFISGPIKVNMEYRLSFSLPDVSQSMLILGKKSPYWEEKCATQLTDPGQFLFKETAKREEGTAFESTDKSMCILGKNYLLNGLNFTPNF